MPKISENRANLTQDDIDDLLDKYSDYYYLVKKAHRILQELMIKYKLTHAQIKQISCRPVPLMKRRGNGN